MDSFLPRHQPLRHHPQRDVHRERDEADADDAHVDDVEREEGRRVLDEGAQAALRVALGVAWATLVASELIAAQSGLGSLIQNAASFFQLDIIYVGIICIGFIALAMDMVLRRVARKLVAWQERIA